MLRRRYGGTCRYYQTAGFSFGTSAGLYPTPMTVATEAWYTGYHPYTLEPIFSAKTQREKLAQRQFFFWYKPEERKNIINELRRIGRGI
ncbi:hypothetical protein BFINE_44240 [Bacteroides finegoldii DSM 17565]|nr:hypothetical protein BFINE_44240 [Bacteroides finegoldii DSM 17565]